MIKGFTLKEWNIQALERDLPRLLGQCHTSLERSMVQTLHGKEIRQLAEQLKRNGKLTPGGKAIAQKYGFKG